MSPGRRTCWTVLFGALVFTAFPDAALPQSDCPDPASFGDGGDALSHVRYLADDRLEGRATASEGERCAAAYLVRNFTRLGLEPGGEGGSWFQRFPVRAGTDVVGGRLRVGDAAVGTIDVAWRPYGFSASGSVEAPLVYDASGFAHPGEEDRLADVTGRIAVIEGEAAGLGGLFGDPHFRASQLAARGAAGVLILHAAGTTLPDPSTEVRPAVGVPVAAVAPAAAGAVRDAARRRRTGAITVSVEPVEAEARNVLALLPGVDPSLREEVVVVGAHYDHLGWGGAGSLAPDAPEIHNGADDNASGTAALIEVAERLLGGPRPSRSVLLIAFSGEEKGLLGSTHYVADPTHPIDHTIAMINMDMVGRLRDNTLTVYGVATSLEWEAVLEEANRGTPGGPLALSTLPDGYGPSDHSSFYGAGVPVLHLFTNTHTEYHRPEDDWETVNGPGIERVADFAAAVVRRLTGTVRRTATRLTPQLQEAPHVVGVAPDDPAPGGGYGPYLGTIPDMAPIDSGVRLTGVRSASPAEAAGLRAGDVIVEFGGREITDLYAYTYALRAHEPGDQVEIVVMRNGERVPLTAVLGQRR